MKTLEFSKKTTMRIVKNFNNSYVGVNNCINDIMALSTIQKCYGIKCKIRVFKTYISDLCYAFYENNNKILEFNSEKEAYKFIFAL